MMDAVTTDFELSTMKGPGTSDGVFGYTMSAEVISVTPHVACAWLDTQDTNRRLDRRLVGRLASDIKSGRWMMTGDAIRFDETGHLIDGQHRLSACVMADMPIETLVIYGLPSTTQRLIDTGKSRSAADVMKLAGVGNGFAVAALARLALAESKQKDTKNITLSPAAILSVVESNKAMLQYCYQRGTLVQGITPAHVGALMFLTSKFSPHKDRAAAFATVLKTGVPDYDGCAAHRLREQLIRLRLSKSESMPTRDVQWQTMKMVWNLFLDREPLGSKHFTKDFVELQDVSYKRAERALWKGIADMDSGSGGDE